MADTLRSIVEGMAHQSKAPYAMFFEQCLKCRLLDLLDAAEKTDLVQKIRQRVIWLRERGQYVGGKEQIALECAAGEASDWADELRNWLAARGISASSTRS